MWSQGRYGDDSPPHDHLRAKDMTAIKNAIKKIECRKRRR
jgi:hypothetical protein